MKFIIKIICLFLTAGTLSGCHADGTEPHACRVVTQIRVVHQVGEATSQRSYSDPKKMELFLTYLRLLNSNRPTRSKSDDLSDGSYRIILRFSDGSEKNYYQHGNRYLSEDGKPWREIDPERASDLDKLYRTTPEDP